MTRGIQRHNSLLNLRSPQTSARTKKNWNTYHLLIFQSKVWVSQVLTHHWDKHLSTTGTTSFLAAWTLQRNEGETVLGSPTELVRRVIWANKGLEGSQLLEITFKSKRAEEYLGFLFQQVEVHQLLCKAETSTLVLRKALHGCRMNTNSSQHWKNLPAFYPSAFTNLSPIPLVIFRLFSPLLITLIIIFRTLLQFINSSWLPKLSLC